MAIRKTTGIKDAELRLVLDSLIARVNVLDPAAAAPPGAVPNFEGDPLTFGNLLSWDAAVNADQYKIYRSASATFSTAALLVTLIAPINFYLDGLGLAGGTYYYWILAENTADVRGPTSAAVLVTNPGGSVTNLADLSEHFGGDNVALTFGDANDDSIKHDGTDMILAPAGRVRIGATGNKNLQCTEIEIEGALNHDGTTVGLYGVAPATRPTALTTQLTTITHTSPGTPDYAVQDLTNVAPYGFVAQDEGNTVLSVIRNLQLRMAELETKLQSLGILT